MLGLQDEAFLKIENKKKPMLNQPKIENNWVHDRNYGKWI